MSLHFIGQRFRGSVSRGGCWQCVPDCRSRLAEVPLISYNSTPRYHYDTATDRHLLIFDYRR